MHMKENHKNHSVAFILQHARHLVILHNYRATHRWKFLLVLLRCSNFILFCDRCMPSSASSNQRVYAIFCLCIVKPWLETWKKEEKLKMTSELKFIQNLVYLENKIFDKSQHSQHLSFVSYPKNKNNKKAKSYFCGNSQETDYLLLFFIFLSSPLVLVLDVHSHFHIHHHGRKIKRKTWFSSWSLTK